MCIAYVFSSHLCPDFSRVYRCTFAQVCDRVLARSSFIAIVGVNSKVISAHRFDFRGRNATKLIVHFDSRLEKEKSFANPSLRRSETLTLFVRRPVLPRFRSIFPAMVCRDAFRYDRPFLQIFRYNEIGATRVSSQESIVPA